MGNRVGKFLQYTRHLQNNKKTGKLFQAGFLVPILGKRVRSTTNFSTLTPSFNTNNQVSIKISARLFSLLRFSIPYQVYLYMKNVVHRMHCVVKSSHFWDGGGRDRDGGGTDRVAVARAGGRPRHCSINIDRRWRQARGLMRDRGSILFGWRGKTLN